MHGFKNLRKLEIYYTESRDQLVVRTIAEDVSIGLGRYLAQDGGGLLQVLQLQRVYPSDLEILVSTLQH